MLHGHVIKARPVIIMNSLTILSLSAATLELTVPAYGLRLIRRFGSPVLVPAQTAP